MLKEPFIQPRFVGARFELATLPLAAAKDLAAYEELVLELAKYLFRQKNQHRMRVPKGFANDFSLHIERIDDGSAKPALVAMVLGVQLFNNFPVEITEAKNLINEVIAIEVGHSFPSAFPKEYYSYFNRIGRSLEEGERIEWEPDAPNNKSVLTPDKRKRLVLAHRETYEAEVKVVGLVEELDAKKKTGILRTLEKLAVFFVYDDPFFADLKEALGDNVIHARFNGIGVFDVNDKLVSISEIEQLELIPHYALASSIEDLSSLQNGWLEGHGITPDNENLNWLTNEVAKTFPDTLEYPSVAPTEDGNVIFEWIRSDARIELEFNFAEKTLELYATNLNVDEFVETIFRLDQLDEALSKVAARL